MRNKSIIMIGLIVAVVFRSEAQNIAITDDNGYVAHPSAMLDIKSTDKGILIPRLTTAQRLAMPVTAGGLLVYDTDARHFFFHNGITWINIAATLDTVWVKGAGIVYLKDTLRALGVGTDAPVAKMEVKSDQTITGDEPIFSVINNTGDTIFAVYNEGVRINVLDEPAKSTSSRSGFAVGGYSLSKGYTNEFLRVTPDSVRVYVPDSSVAKGASTGGFAVGGYSLSKSNTFEFLRVTPDSVRVYVPEESPVKGASTGGFAVGGYSISKGVTGNLLFVDNDSSRIYINDSTAGFKVTNAQGGGSDGLFNISVNNCFLGDKSGRKTQPVKAGSFEDWYGIGNTFIGNQSGFYNTTGRYNLFLGFRSGYNNIGGMGEDGSYNTFIGFECGRTNTEGGSNTFLGYQSGIFNTTGDHNTYIGRWTGAGAGAAMPGANGSYNVFIGTEAGRYEQQSYRLCIDAKNEGVYTPPLIYGEFLGNGGNKRVVVIDGDSLDNIMNRTFFVNGDAGGHSPWNIDSDRRLKQDITTIPDALQKVQQLRGVNFTWKDQERHPAGLQMGFIAQEAINVVPEVVEVRDDHYQMTYSSLTALLVEAIKEQQKIIDELKNENKDLKAEVDKINDLQRQLDAINQRLNSSAGK